MLLRFLYSIATGKEFSLNESAEFLGYFAKRKILNSKNKGLLIDGKSLRLGANSSYEHLALVARTGGGKTTKFIIPNILTLDNCSIVVTDPSGEIHEKTHRELIKKGFELNHSGLKVQRLERD